MIWKLLLIFVLSELCFCGLCGVTSDRDTPLSYYMRIFGKANRACGVLDSVSDDIRISDNFSHDINLMIESFDKLEMEFKTLGFNTIEKDIQYLVEYLQTIVNFASTWEKGVEFIRDMTLLILRNKDLTVCDDLVLEVEKWRQEHYRIQKVIQTAQASYQQFIDCLQDAQSDSCDYSMALPMVLAAKHDEQTTVANAQKVADFRQKYSKFQKEYHRFQPSSSEWNLRILWLSSFNLSNYRFTEEITKELDDHSEAVEPQRVDTLSQLADVKVYLDEMENLVENVNSGTNIVDDLFTDTSTLATKLEEIQQLNTFLDDSFKDKRPLCERIKKSLPDEFVTTSRMLSVEQQRFSHFPSTLYQRWFLYSDMMRSEELYDLASSRNEDLNTAFTVIENHSLRGSNSMLIRKEIYDFYVIINHSIISYYKCSKLGLFGGYSLTAIQTDRYFRDEVYNESYNVIVTHTMLKFMSFTKDFLEEQQTDLTAFSKYIAELVDNADAVDPIIRTMSTSHVTKFKIFLSKATEILKDLFDAQCMTSTSRFIGALIKQLSLDSSFSFDDFFETDPKVQEAINNQSDYSSIQDIVDDILDNSRNSWDSIEDIYTAITKVLNDALTFIGKDYDSSQSTTLEDLLQQATSESIQISEIKSKSEEYSALPTHLGPIALKTFSLHFPESPA